MGLKSKVPGGRNSLESFLIASKAAGSIIRSLYPDKVKSEIPIQDIRSCGGVLASVQTPNIFSV
ncbi:hypothetical protein [Arabidopsis thaliana]|nr:hypothetical protein ISN45_At04g033110 [Arabidopsis thaliana x Arabidopsis arenosa]KAG7622465.1 hypothetical protein ISN44_As04g032560 [Arabidopsis suecica]CAA16529.1 hypothetical protein [Arabidopsis thaliana]CAB79844.1 hypothetical protein [Arabidopsis thaliana]